MTETEIKLRNEIKAQLDRVTYANSPNIWDQMQTAQGYLRLEQTIIDRMLATQLTPGAIIPQLEQEAQMM